MDQAILRGVEYIAGFPCVPNALKQIFGTVEADGRQVPNWYGSLPETDQRIVELTKRRDAAQAALDSHLKTAEQLLGETVAT